MDLEQSFGDGDVGVVDMAVGDVGVVLHDRSDLAEVGQHDLEAELIHHV